MNFADIEREAERLARIGNASPIGHRLARAGRRLEDGIARARDERAAGDELAADLATRIERLKCPIS